VPPKEGTGGDRHDAGGRTLGDVLYADQAKLPIPENAWVELLRSIAARDQRALQHLYERIHRIVFTLSMRITGNRETAEEVTLDVIHEVWRRAESFDPAAGTVVAWIMNMTRSRALDRLRFDQRQKRKDQSADCPVVLEEGEQPDDAVHAKDQRRRLHHALRRLSDGERQAIETAFFSELTYTETAARLGQPIGTIKTRIRAGLEKLRQALRERAFGS
jgi:RNA polymerase sigma-70 factor (ECF subfamily)